MACFEQALISRRALLASAGGLFAWSFMPKSAFAAGGRDFRLILVVLRGGLDGLAAVPPLADPNYLDLRESIALASDGPEAALKLDGFFGLHPAMPRYARMFRNGKATIVHAAATGYRGRSHFDAQDVLESGQPVPGLTDSGWLNRAAGLVPAGDPVSRSGILGVGAEAPLIVRGPAPMIGWAPPFLARADDDIRMRLMELYRHQDPFLAGAFAAGLETEAFALADADAADAMDPGRDAVSMAEVAAGTARLVAADDGPRIAALAFNGWDTHANEGGATGQLARRLAKLDTVLGVLERNLGDKWNDTVVLVMTEFGRTVEVNGTDGTDHGTATVALLAGGAVNGGHVVADWPGLHPADLYEGRDLNPTLDLRAVAKGLLADLFGLSEQALATDVFPDTASIRPFQNLIA